MSKLNVIATVVNNAREQVRVSLDRYQGHDLIDARMGVELNPETGAMVPTKKGISLRVEKLPARPPTQAAPTSSGQCPRSYSLGWK